MLMYLLPFQKGMGRDWDADVFIYILYYRIEGSELRMPCLITWPPASSKKRRLSYLFISSPVRRHRKNQRTKSFSISTRVIDFQKYILLCVAQHPAILQLSPRLGQGQTSVILNTFSSGMFPINITENKLRLASYGPRLYYLLVLVPWCISRSANPQNRCLMNRLASSLAFRWPLRNI